MYSKDQISAAVNLSTKRDAVDKLEFELMVNKYLYYEMDRPILSDYEYDKLEKQWYNLAFELGLVEEGNHTPCVGFSHGHRMASGASVEGKKRLGIKDY